MFRNADQLTYKASPALTDYRKPGDQNGIICMSKYFTNYFFIYRSRLNMMTSSLSNRYDIKQEPKERK